MPNAVDRCLNCQHELEADRKAGLTYCSRCGTGLPSEAQETRPTTTDPDTGEPVLPNATERKRWKLCFWLLFIGTPLCMGLVGMPDMDKALPAPVANLVPPAAKVLLTLACGLLAAGYCLARLNEGSRGSTGRIVYAFLWSIALLVAYMGIAFVGCAIIGGLSRI